MEETYIRQLLAANNICVTEGLQQLFADFVTDPANKNLVNQILENQKRLMDQWALKIRLADLDMQEIVFPNATVGKPYEYRLDMAALQWEDIALLTIDGLDTTGLTYDPATKVVSGIPVISGDMRLALKYRLKKEAEDVPPHEKKIRLVVNPDPRSLWKNVPSDTTDPFWKADVACMQESLGAKQVVAASKRGRSHANNGGFREDDYLVKHWAETGWSLLAVSDGAGSAQYSREGSRLACTFIASYFDECMTAEWLATADRLIKTYNNNSQDKATKALNSFIYETLGNGVLQTHKKIEETAARLNASLNDFHATLAFVLMKQYDFGYAIMSFSVGDGPVGLLDEKEKSVTLLNWLDVGEYGGGTRFITMPEIFSSGQFSSRFNFILMPGFSHLILMTDGIYDPKFEVEANLTRWSAWQRLIADLAGENEGRQKVTLERTAAGTEQELAAWLDFWSVGNHDDRTLMIVY